jgi:hypothetical protein
MVMPTHAVAALANIAPEHAGALLSAIAVALPVLTGYAAMLAAAKRQSAPEAEADRENAARGDGGPIDWFPF